MSTNQPCFGVQISDPRPQQQGVNGERRARDIQSGPKKEPHRNTAIGHWTDFHGAWQDTAEQLRQAFEQPEVLDKVHSLPFGDFPGDAAVDLAVSEVGIHSADLAQATRQHIADQTPFAAVLQILRARMTDAWRAPGILNDEQPVPPRASTIDELLAYAGRRIDESNGSSRRPSEIDRHRGAGRVR